MRRGTGPLRSAVLVATLGLLAGCNRHQSTFATFGEEAAGIGGLALTMTIGAAVIALAMAVLMWLAVRAPEGRLTLQRGETLILIAGGLIPALLLLGLLVYSLPFMRPRPVTRADLSILVTGEQFWWRVDYQPPGAAPFASANEVRIPVGRTVAFRLRAADVIHSFWIPGLAGKMDMIPGRENVMPVRATRPGIYRGQCAEFCGLSHALMAFDVIAMEPAAFDRWAAQQRLARSAASPGRALFASYGCGGCHAVAGTEAAGRIGPDLSHIGARRTLAAGILAPTEANMAAFIRRPDSFKPGVRMPAFPHMPLGDARAIARYLGTLR